MKNKKPRGFSTLKKSLINNLAARGMIEEIYTDKVDEYMNLWSIRRDLEADIAARGVTVHDDKRGMDVENRSVSLLAQVSRQMLSIYQALGFKDGASAVFKDDDEL